ncbi:hypothetical protein [Nesterenkonia sandarakina]|uniref:hypothetical protein n=1 Tax=Nesterenkonia sandarakina TaxID=272918 RepID=UPI000D073AE2|nr:hypothetical protein [Nesterenkonia sandarakina]
MLLFSAIRRTAVPTAKTTNAPASSAASADVPGQPAEPSSISGQDRQGFRNIVKPQTIPVRVSSVPVTA